MALKFEDRFIGKCGIASGGELFPDALKEGIEESTWHKECFADRDGDIRFCRKHWAAIKYADDLAKWLAACVTTEGMALPERKGHPIAVDCCEDCDGQRALEAYRAARGDVSG